MNSNGGPYVDERAGRLVRPYTVSAGRTCPSVAMQLLSTVVGTGTAPRWPLDLDHALALTACSQPVTVAEIAARLQVPVAATKVLISDLVECGAARVHPPEPLADCTNVPVLEMVLDALSRGVPVQTP